MTRKSQRKGHCEISAATSRMVRAVRKINGNNKSTKMVKDVM